jgi:hypothetical protein
MKNKKIKGTKDSVCNDCYDDGFKGSPCPHIEDEELLPVFDAVKGEAITQSSMSEELKKEWEREFEEKYADRPLFSILENGKMIKEYGNIISFISSLLAKQQEEFVKKVKGMLMDDSNHNDYYYGYNDALNDLLEDFADIKNKLKI